jgi:hypothetical protein
MNRYLASWIAVLFVTLMGCVSTPMLTAKNTPLCGDGTVPTVTQHDLTLFLVPGVRSDALDQNADKAY